MPVFSKARPAQSERELFRTPEADVEHARVAGVQLASELFAMVLEFAEPLQEQEPARSQMLLEADFFATAFVTSQAGRWYSQEPIRAAFVHGLRGQFALIAAVSTDSSKEPVFRSEYELVVSDRQQQYNAMLVSRPLRRFRFVQESSDIREVHRACAAFTGSPQQV